MKVKLKNIDYSLINYNEVNSSTLNDGTLVNISYLDNELEFQSCKTIINSINNNYFELKLLPTEASRTFYNKLIQLENEYNKYLLTKNINKQIKSIFKNEYFTVKIPFKNNHPLVKVYDKDNKLINFYKLINNNTIICLFVCKNLWITKDSDIHYQLTVKEILLLE